MHEGVVLDDCRFDNEAAMIHGLGGVVIRIERPGCTRMGHLSENAISPDSFDTVLYNDFKTIFELQTALAATLDIFEFPIMPAVRAAA